MDQGLKSSQEEGLGAINKNTYGFIMYQYLIVRV